jgi:hypothetical protein
MSNMGEENIRCAWFIKKKDHVQRIYSNIYYHHNRSYNLGQKNCSITTLIMLQHDGVHACKVSAKVCQCIIFILTYTSYYNLGQVWRNNTVLKTATQITHSRSVALKSNNVYWEHWHYLCIQLTNQSSYIISTEMPNFTLPKSYRN